ncbi:immunoglobulin kappa light chain-like [Hyperolius riggenbachi]|uniref:immunoglobulin kappa light chain-like n=1 Tax=Hyperolius riggenbachi TaxID=752182 RepID=UPI0035A36A87
MKYLPVFFIFYITVVKVLICASRLMSPPSLEQTLPSITTAGKNPTLRCILRGSKVSNHVLSWYRQTEEREIQFLVSHRNKNRPTYGKGIAERFIPELEETLNAFTLTIGNADKSDEGLNYCAAFHSNQYIFGQGTEIRVQDKQTIHRPSMVLFQPSFLEIQYDTSATFLCHVENYFPEPVRIKWLLNNKTQDVETIIFPAVKNTRGTFDQTSAGSIPGNLWNKNAVVACVVDHESGVQTMTITAAAQMSECSSKECMRNLTSSVTAITGTKPKKKELRAGCPVLSAAVKLYSAILYSSVLYGTILSSRLIQRKLAKPKAAENVIVFSKKISTITVDHHETE